MGRALQAASTPESAATQSVHQSSQPSLQPRPFLASVRFVPVFVPVRRHFSHSLQGPPPPRVPSSSPDDGRDPEHGRLKLGQRVPGEFAIYSEWLPPTGGCWNRKSLGDVFTALFMEDLWLFTSTVVFKHDK